MLIDLGEVWHGELDLKNLVGSQEVVQEALVEVYKAIVKHLLDGEVLATRTLGTLLMVLSLQRSSVIIF